MDRERWQRIEQLYNSALAIAAAERAEFLDRECAGDAELRREIVSLLSAHVQAGSFLASPAVEDAARRLAAQSITAGGDPPTPALIGRSIQQYRILSAIGKGGMGEVWLAEDTRLHRKVALKLLPAEFAGDADRVRRFEQEARAVTALNHPNIVTLFDLGRSESDYFMATEFVDGRTLREHLLERAKLPAGEAIAIVAQIADALAAAHEAGIVHRDIKPENVMLRRDGYVKVLDFGLAKIGGNFGGETVAAPSSITEAGAVMGTVSYMSPEQARGLRVDARTDVFSLGVVLHEMLAGRTPFEGATASDVIASILRAEPNRIADVPEELNRIVMKSLAKDRDERHQTVADFARDLKVCSRELEFQTRLADSPDSKRWQSGYEDAKTAEVLPANSVEASGGSIMSRRPAARKYLLGTATAGLAIFTFWAFWQFFGRQRGNFESEVLPNLKFSRVTSWMTEAEPGTSLISSSPDGGMIAYSRARDGHSDIYVQQLNGGVPRKVTDNQGENFSPIWSPDGQRLAYISVRDGRAEIWLIPFLGGPGQMLTAMNPTPRWLTKWSADGERIYYERQGNLFAIELATKQIRPITDFRQPGSTKNEFAVSPDERWLAYVETVADVMQLQVSPIAGGAPVQLTHGSESSASPLWLPDGERLIYASKRNGVEQICMAWRDGRKPVQITFGHERMIPWDVTRDGRTIFYFSEKDEASLYLLDLATEAERRLSDEVLLELFPHYAPDGKTLVFQRTNASAELYQSAIYTRQLAGDGAPVRVTALGFDPHWSPLGERIAFLRQQEEDCQLWVARKDGAEEKPVAREKVVFTGYTPKPFGWVYSNYNWSPDGRRLAYSSDKAGSSNLYAIAADGTDEIALTDNRDPLLRFYSPLWAPDGKRFAFVTARQSAVASPSQSAGGKPREIYVSDGKQSTQLLQTDAQVRLLAWSPMGEHLLIAQVAGPRVTDPAEVQLLRLAPDSRNPIVQAKLPTAYLSNVVLAPGGRQVAFAARQHNADNIWIASLPNGQPRQLTTNADPKLNLGGLVWAPQRNQLCFIKQSNAVSIRTIENFK